jgi:hypothetical protein
MTPQKKLMWGYFYIIVLSVVVFTPTFSYICEFFKLNWLYLCILWVVISLLDDYYKKLVNIRYVKYVAYGISLLGLDKDLVRVLAYRNKVSICAILIEKSVGNIKKVVDRNSPVSRYAYYINYAYVY